MKKIMIAMLMVMSVNAIASQHCGTTCYTDALGNQQCVTDCVDTTPRFGTPY